MKTRKEILDSKKSIPAEGGVYFWYISEDGADRLGFQTDGCTEKDGMYLVYIGLSKNIRERLGQHLNGNTTGSTMRKKLSALLFGNFSEEVGVSRFMDDCFKIEYRVDSKYKLLETELISTHILPLNDKSNDHKFIEVMREVIKKVRKKV